ncbi:MAG: hypothetical protein BWY80_00456 [Firmicutes bacterium ADurb.Bin456]|nr:MAG: hypothetical protein BWY80_00456 [Firmicutes bacterium ADurb.Bin456]
MIKDKVAQTIKDVLAFIFLHLLQHMGMMTQNQVRPGVHRQAGQPGLGQVRRGLIFCTGVNGYNHKAGLFPGLSHGGLYYFFLKAGYTGVTGPHRTVPGDQGGIAKGQKGQLQPLYLDIPGSAGFLLCFPGPGVLKSSLLQILKSIQQTPGSEIEHMVVGQGKDSKTSFL